MASNIRDTTTTTRPRQRFQSPALKKLGQGFRLWIHVDTSGNTQPVEEDKFTTLRRFDLPARDLPLFDPKIGYPSTILGREKAIVVNLEQIRCIITADKVALLNGLDYYGLQYVEELQKRLTSSGAAETLDGNNVFGNSNSSTSPDYLPFEFLALELALEAACTFLDAQAAELEADAYPLLDELTTKISTLNLERVRSLKSYLVALTRRVQKVRDEIEQLMDDDGGMAEMYLTEKKSRMESSFYGDQSVGGYGSVGGGPSVSAPVSPVSSLPDGRRQEKCLSTRNRHETAHENTKELEMVLAAYLVVFDTTLNKLTALKEYIDDTEDFVSFQLDKVRNQLIQFELLLTTASFVVAIFGLVAGIFGMNFEIPLFDKPSAFNWVLVITGICGMVVFGLCVWFFRHRRLMPL